MVHHLSSIQLLHDLCSVLLGTVHGLNDTFASVYIFPYMATCTEDIDMVDQIQCNIFSKILFSYICC